MKEYISIPKDKAYHLLNFGPMILVSTVSADNKHNITPIAWQCPVEYDPTTRVLFVTDKDHKAFKNISETGHFIISVPHVSQLHLVKDLGSCSGNDTDKIEKYNINTFNGNKVNCVIPDDVIGFLECKLYKVVDEGSVAIIFGEVIAASADKEAYTGRVLTEKEEGKTIHHLGGSKFFSPSDTTIK
jgi:flavin reductase (DIM6/NTAB) family NADH-FMN oxidoreductase RutF